LGEKPKTRVPGWAASHANFGWFDDPLAVDERMLDADLFEAGGAVRGAAGVVISEDAAREFVEAAPLGLCAELGEQLVPEALAPAVGVDVDGVLADVLVEAAV
jgi:hypothetical protein